MNQLSALHRSRMFIFMGLYSIGVIVFMYLYPGPNHLRESGSPRYYNISSNEFVHLTSMLTVNSTIQPNAHPVIGKGVQISILQPAAPPMISKDKDDKMNNVSESCNPSGIKQWLKGDLKENFTLNSIKHLAVEASIIDSSSICYKEMEDQVIRLHGSLNVAPLQGLRLPNKPETSNNHSHHTSLGFIKAFKVGGTLISSLLNTYVYNNNLHLNSGWPSPNSQPNIHGGGRCADVIGTHHPSKYFYQHIKSQYTKHYFCSNFMTFMFVRDPMQRIWSAYNHYIKDEKAIPKDLHRFFFTGHEILTAPHEFLSMGLKKAIEISENILILSQDDKNMDKSLVLLALKANLSICDILYEPCKDKGNDWPSAKCNDEKRWLDKSSRDTILRYLTNSGESAFYNMAMKRFQKEISGTKMKEMLNKYLAIREKASQACSSNVSHMAWENTFMVDPRAVLTKDGRHWTLRGEGEYPLVPAWVCMQNYCRAKITEWDKY